MADLFRPFFSQVSCDEDGDTGGKLRDDEGDQVQHLAAGGNGGKPGGGAKLSDDQQVNSAVSSLQNQGSQDREHEQGQLL